jgi:hypothetical protein
MAIEACNRGIQSCMNVLRKEECSYCMRCVEIIYCMQGNGIKGIVADLIKEHACMHGV